jgi:hypothetical protein
MSFLHAAILSLDASGSGSAIIITICYLVDSIGLPFLIHSEVILPAYRQGRVEANKKGERSLRNSVSASKRLRKSLARNGELWEQRFLGHPQPDRC